VEAVDSGNKDTIRSLLDDKADPTYRKSTESETVLHRALSHVVYNNEIVKMLLEAGASVNAVHSEYGCHHSTSETCFQKGLMLCYSHDDDNLLNLLLKYGGNPNDCSNNSSGGMRSDRTHQYYPIHEVVGRGSVKCTRVLLEAKADVNSQQKLQGSSEFGDHQNTQETALHLACQTKNSTDLVQVLVAYGADVNFYREKIKNEIIDPELGWRGKGDPRRGNWTPNIRNIPIKETPLHIAIAAQSPELVRLLILSRADPNLPFKESLYHASPTTKSTWELCQGKVELLEALKLKFSPETFRFNGKPLREAIIVFLLCEQRMGWKLPKEVSYRIFDALISVWV